MNIINDIRLKALVERIQAKSANKVEQTLESILQNLDVLLEEKEVNGEKQKYLPLSIKEEVFHLAYPEGVVLTEVEYDKAEKMAMAKSLVYADKDRTILLGEGFADQKTSTLPIFGMEDTARQATRRIAKGRAKSDALRDAGIASWLQDSYSIQMDNAADVADQDVKKEQPVDKTKEVDEAFKNALERTKAKFGQPQTAEEVPFDFDPEQQIAPGAENDASPEKFKFVSGKYSEKTLEEVAETDPGFLVKLYALDRQGSYKMPDELKRNLVAYLKKSKGSGLFEDALESFSLTYKDVA